MPDWRVEQLRLTAFLSQNLLELQPNWWREIVGVESAAKTVQRGVLAQEHGPLPDGYCQLTLAIQPAISRVDWFMTPILQATEGSPPQPLRGFPAFDFYPGALARFREMMGQWLPTMETIKRIAVGSVLSVAVEGKEAGYRAAAELLPHLRLDPIHSSDLLFQINRHAVSKTAGLEGLPINRLSVWNVPSVKSMQLQFQFQPGEVPLATMRDPSTPELIALRLQLDINTDANRPDPFSPAVLTPLTSELIAYGTEIADRGDRP